MSMHSRLYCEYAAERVFNSMSMFSLPFTSPLRSPIVVVISVFVFLRTKNKITDYAGDSSLFISLVNYVIACRQYVLNATPVPCLKISSVCTQNSRLEREFEQSLIVNSVLFV